MPREGEAPAEPVESAALQGSAGASPSHVVTFLSKSSKYKPKFGRSEAMGFLRRASLGDSISTTRRKIRNHHREDSLCRKLCSARSAPVNFAFPTHSRLAPR